MARHFLTGEELTSDELGLLIERALELKEDRRGSDALDGHSVALVFERPSTRTRVSFEVGITEMGGHPIVMRPDETQLSRGESLRDFALVLSRFVAAVGVRTAAQSALDEVAMHSHVPVINMLTDEHHPCQALADLLTLRERFGRLAGLKLAYVGDGNNVAHSLMLLGAKAGVEVAIATPEELRPEAMVAELAGGSASDGGGVTLTSDPSTAAADAHALYTDVWVSMGDEEQAGPRRATLEPYRLDASLLERARPDAIALHCLPAHPGEEIAEEVLYGDRSAVWDQAENRLHAQKALLELLVARPPLRPVA
ncbi:MAG: ornithine carbamoyltransferase [Actinobacteria bacterium]|nr:ornithine carbamoyltransferase [Actinomycetota bacterium]